MDKLFITVLNNALVVGWFILAVIILRLIARKIPKRIYCLLWGLVAIRLLIPFGIKSIFSLIPSAEPVPKNIGYVGIPRIYSGISAVNKVINPILENNLAAVETYSVNPMQVFLIICSLIWIVGISIMLIYALISFIVLKKRVRTSTPIDKRINRCGTIESPFILGIFRPTIYVPESLGKDAFDYVTEHERAHISRGDFIWKPLGFLILSVYWFNPLCWIAYIMFCKDIEYACDEKVTADKDKSWKAEYCQVLLDFSSGRNPISVYPVAFGEVSVKDRVKSVINYKKPATWIICISVFACIVLAVCFMTNPKESRRSNDIKAGKYIKTDQNADPALYLSCLSVNDDGTFSFSPSIISSYMGIGTWETDGDYVVFKDKGMGDTRKQVFRNDNGKLYYVADKSSGNSMWGLADGTEYVIYKDAPEKLLPFAEMWLDE